MSWWKMAVAAAVLLFAGAMGWNYFFSGGESENGPDQPVVVKKSDPSSTEKADQAKTPTTDPRTTESFVATTTDKENAAKENAVKNNTEKGIEPVPSKDNEPLIAVNNPKNDDPLKKIEGHSNEKLDESVLQSGGVNATPEKVEAIAIAKTPVVDVARNLEAVNDKLDKNDNPQASFAFDTNNELAVLNTSIKKNTSRGFFRKVGRVVGKVTNIGPKADKETDDNSKGVRIANFEIALK
jgi:hypothetical protein